MILLVNGSPKNISRYAHSGFDAHLGWLTQPRSGNQVWTYGGPWACDNGAFSGFNAKAFERMLTTVCGRPGLLWVVAPDVVGDHEATVALWRKWLAKLNAYCVPKAFVLQNGCGPEDPPWDELDAVFVGGDDDYKLGPVAAAIVRKAKSLGKLAHMGRVNSAKRIAYAHSIGCDSVDGTSMSRFPAKHIPLFLRSIKALNQERWC